MAKWLALAVLMVVSSVAGAVTWEEGKHYEVLQPFDAKGNFSGKVQVIEFFQYGCGHCYAMEPYLVMWSRSLLKDNDVEFVRIPVTYRPQQRALARLYYSLNALGRIDAHGANDLHHEVFDAIYRRGVKLTAQDEDEAFAAQLEFARTCGIDEARFSEAYRSPTVDKQLEEAGDRVREFRIDGTPMFVVNGKYKTHVGMAGGQQELIALLGELVRREKASAAPTARR